MKSMRALVALMGIAAAAIALVRIRRSRRVPEVAAPAPIVPYVPTDNTTLLEVISSLEAEGFSSAFELADDGYLLCTVCSRTSPADLVTVDVRRRLEGASDPADMVSVMGIACPQCGSRGTLVVHYGPEADESEVAFMSRSVGSPRTAEADISHPD